MSEGALEWKFSQMFGNRNPAEDVSDGDIVSAIEFDHTGDYIAAGDRSGRVVLFERVHGSDSDDNYDDEEQQQQQQQQQSSRCEYKFYCEFQSHQPEFDYLKSLEIEEKINKIKWYPKQLDAHFLLTTNDKTIKLWKVYEKKVKQLSSTTLSNGSGSGNNHISIQNNNGSSNSNSIDSMTDDNNNNSIFKIPRLTTTRETTAFPKKVYANAHAYHINSISLNSDGETYISSDDLRIHLWNLNNNHECFNVVDIKPTNMEDLTEVITSAEFHPTSCNIFMYSSSKGTIKLGDLRSSALCDQHSKVFEEPDDPSTKSFFSEIISSISDIKFSRDGRYILSRDYLTLKLWDINMESRPLKSIQIHDYLRPRLCDLYENDCIFDKFECAINHDGSQMLTGSYNNFFHIYERDSKQDVFMEASRNAYRPRTRSMADLSLDFTKKALHVSWHPTENLIALGTSNSMYLFSATN
ncbi:hypothetical protein SAMD00019534_058920 [Acytostelium subglobosum LB1]|uniref:hypothetical protein n=1 Tax=Acytostelium subglobosum LB1 TaxID=1410327 RepID=UPI000644E01A|nr:hypothetical protein SAMD00019534_058920 [Acytostelium subglobosum LB1]GAM22717.1 hypothetical protein SAMD00019534_058920 [Acytostelium subglobosum LB1]|eukprot:XP_012753944.1 hypothetical protein SAMD00019534_058920 [Acytostelium subglobosum LB1]